MNMVILNNSDFRSITHNFNHPCVFSNKMKLQCKFPIFIANYVVSTRFCVCFAVEWT